MLYAENIPDWLWIVLVAAGVLVWVGLGLRRRYERNRRHLALARHNRRVAHGKAWNWLQRETRPRRLTQQSQGQTPHD